MLDIRPKAYLFSRICTTIVRFQFLKKLIVEKVTLAQKGVQKMGPPASQACISGTVNNWMMVQNNFLFLLNVSRILHTHFLEILSFIFSVVWEIWKNLKCSYLARTSTLNFSENGFLVYQWSLTTLYTQLSWRFRIKVCSKNSWCE